MAASVYGTDKYEISKDVIRRINELYKKELLDDVVLLEEVETIYPGKSNFSDGSL